MDLNQLYFDHQVLLIGAARALSCELRKEHELGASQIAQRIGCMQKSVGAGAAAGWDAVAATSQAFAVSYASCVPGARL